MTTFNDLPTHIQYYIFEFNPEHRENLKKIHEDLFADFHAYNMSYVFDELIHSLEYVCDYEYCESRIPIGEEYAHTLDLPGEVNVKTTYRFCNENCCSAGMYWIEDDLRKFLRNRAAQLNASS